MVELQNPKGMKDVMPEEKIARDKIVQVIKEVFENYGFVPLDTPVLERLDVLTAKYAGGAEILKETLRATENKGQ